MFYEFFILILVFCYIFVVDLCIVFFLELEYSILKIKVDFNDIVKNGYLYVIDNRYKLIDIK